MRSVPEESVQYDFKDGNGLVFAHRHCNGGGWVADTAHVDDSARVEKNAQVFGYAHVLDNSVIGDNAEISAFVTVKDNASIKGRAVVRGSAIIMDDVEISSDVVIIGHFKIGGDITIDENQHFFNAKDCLKCPAMLSENYTGSDYNPCLHCIEKLRAPKNKISDSRRENMRSWFGFSEGVNQNNNDDDNDKDISSF